VAGSTPPIRPRDAGVEPSVFVWLPSIQPSARSQTIRANEKSDASAVSREWPQQGADDIRRRPVVACDLDFASLQVALAPEAQFIRGDPDVAVMGRDVNTFPNGASGGLPHEQVRGLSGIVESLGHSPRGQKWNLFAVYPAPEKPAFIAPRVQDLLSHHLIAVTIKINPFIFSDRFLKKPVPGKEIKNASRSGLQASCSARRRRIASKINDFACA